MSPTDSMFALPGFVFDAEHSELRDESGAIVRLRPQCLAALHCLIRNVGHVVGKADLIQAVWPGADVSDDSLVQCIAYLRRALRDDAQRVVQTEPRRGYRLLATRIPTDAAGGPASAAVGNGFSQRIHFATSFDGVRLAWASAGDGVPIVRCAHWMTHLDWDWRSAALGGRIQAFARHHRYVRYDMRGSGLSERGVDPGDLETQVRDLRTVVDAAWLGRFVLLGISAGAAIAIRFAARYPERVERLMLMGGFARGVLRRGERSQPIETFEAYSRILEDGWGRENAASRQLMTTQLYPDASLEQQRSFNEMQRLACSPPQAAKILRMVANFDASDALTQLRCPTLVVHSRRDARVPFEEGRALAATIPGARLEALDTANHMPLPGEPAFDALTHLVNGFVAEAVPDPVVRPPEVAERDSPPRRLRLVGGDPRDGPAKDRRRRTVPEKRA